ncbi:hypothetical protein GF314_13975 [bacterium]|nr:hypothetical protein [bacterium]
MNLENLQTTALALLATLALLSVALPAIAACCAADCCDDVVGQVHGEPGEAASHHDPAAETCLCCTVSDCGIDDPGLAVMGPAEMLVAPVIAVAIVEPERACDRPQVTRDVAPAIPPCLTSTVLLI